MKKIWLSNVFLIIVLLTLSIFFRTYRVFSTFNWTGDSARDFFVAEHNILFNEFSIFARPASGGADGAIRNSPVYFIFLSILRFLFLSEKNIIIFYGLLNSIIAFVAFKLGEMHSGKKTGFLFGVLVSMSSIILMFSRQVVQESLHALFTLTAITFLYYAVKKTNIFFLFLGAQVAYLIPHFHLSGIPVAVSFILFCFFYLVVTKNIHFSKKFIIFIGMCFFVFINQSFLFSATALPGEQNTEETFFANIIELDNKVFLKNIFKSIVLILINIFNIDENNYFIISMFFCIFIFQILLTFKRNKITENDYFANVLIALITITTIFLSGLYKFSSGVYRYYPSLILILTQFVFFSSRFKNNYLRLLFSLLLVLFVTRSTNFWLLKPSNDEYLVDQSISKIILEDIEQDSRILLSSPLNFNIYASDTGTAYNFFNHSYWFFMERFSNQKLVSLKQDGNNVIYNQSPEFGYLICYFELPGESCLNQFTPPSPILEIKSLASFILPFNSREVLKLTFEKQN